MFKTLKDACPMCKGYEYEVNDMVDIPCPMCKGEKTIPVIVELRMSGKSCPPDFVGQAGNMSTCWFRVNGGEWEPALHRSMHKNMEWLEQATSVQEYRKSLERS